MAYLCHIDRSASARALVAELAGTAGWHVASFSDMGEAIAEIQARIPDLIVTASTHVSSVHLAETVATLRGDPGIAAIPIVLLTGSRRRDTVSSAMEMGVAEVFFKEELDAFRKYLTDVAASYPGAEQHQRRVLVLDDDRAIGALIQHILKNRGIQVDLCRSIPAALSAARDGPYDVVIADIVLADDRSGNHFIREVRRLGGRYATLPIVAISGFLDAARRIDSLRAGATLCIAKPVEHAELILVIERLLHTTSPVPVSVPCAGCEGVPDMPDLTGREGLVCRMAIKGIPDKEIARRLGISYWTVRTYMGRIFQKYGVANRVELARRCLGGELPQDPVPPPAQAVWNEISADVVSHLHYGVVVTDADQKILWVNPAFSKITGYEAAEVLGKTPRLWKSGKQDPLFYKDMFGQLTGQGHWSGELWNRHKQGRLFLEALEIRSLPPGSPQNARYVGLIADITERHLGTERVRHSALQDPLTGLANRTLLWDRAAQEIAHARRSKKPLAIAFVDLDRFKPVNDTLGHEAGDAVLVEIAERLRTRIRHNDTLARYGGDEFVVVLPEVGSREQALGVAAKLLQALGDPVRCHENDLSVSASIGLSFYPDDGADVDALIAAADRAMYRAKSLGGGQVRVFEHTSDAVLENGRLVGYPLKQALERGGFVLHFQPIVDVQSRRTIAAEVMLRLMDPQIGLVFPAEILPLAERSGFMPSLGRWILWEACKCLRRIQNSGFQDFSLTINLASSQVFDAAFSDQVEAVIAETGVCASSVQLDIPGSVFAQGGADVSKALERLARTGVSLAFDDFGMGCSGPGCLRHATFEGLKIDRRLIAGAHSDRFNAAVVRSVFGLAGDLGIAAVAKGVEGHQDLDFLAELGCTVAQGFLFAPPMQETELMAWLFASDIASETFD